MGAITRMEGTGSLPCRLIAAACLATMVSAGAANAQSLTVLPVGIQMEPGQLATSLTILNQGSVESSIQVRTFKWSQAADGSQQLTSSEDVVASPPIGTIAPGATQVVRLILRYPAHRQEESYRLLVDQIPPAAQSGTVRIALRLSIPVFAEPAERANAHVVFHIERNAAGAFLIAVNDGTRHQTIRDIALTTTSGVALKVAPNTSPYLLAGTTHRWRIETPVTGGAVHLVAHADTGTLDQSVAVIAAS